MEVGLLDAPMFSARGDELPAARDFVTGFGLPAAVVCAVRVSVPTSPREPQGSGIFGIT